MRSFISALPSFWFFSGSAMLRSTVSHGMSERV